MKIIVDQATCGEKNKGWDLLKTTMSSLDDASKIAYKSGPPDQPPAGVLWYPFTRAFVFKENFLFIKIFLDMSPDVRPGRGFSHVLVLKKDALIQLQDISILFSLFPKQIDKNSELIRIQIESVHDNTILSSTESSIQRFNKVIKTLNELDHGYGTIVWVGQEDYDFAISRFWKLLSLEEKNVVNFGLYFNPSELDQTKLNFICTTEMTETKFMNTSCTVIRKGDSITLSHFADKILAGDNATGERFSKFQNELGRQNFSRSEIQKVSKVISTYEDLTHVDDFKRILTLASIIAEYAPSRSTAVNLKERILARIKDFQNILTPTELHLLRYFRVDSYRNSEELLSQMVSEWLKGFLFNEEKNQLQDYSDLIKALYKSKEKDWLSSHFTQSIRSFLIHVRDDTVKVIFQWLLRDIHILDILHKDINTDFKYENAFVKNIDTKMDESLFSALKTFAAKRNWYKFHALLLKNHRLGKSALQEQILVDTDVNNFDGINLIAKGLKDEEIVSTALVTNDHRLTTLAGAICQRDTTYLKEIDIKNSVWQSIWLEAIKLGNKVDDGIMNPASIAFKFFDIVVEDLEYNRSLLEEISETRYANLLFYPSREQFWLKVPLALKKRFLTKTASDLLLTLSRDFTFNIPEDKVLSDFILKEDYISDFLFYNRSNFRVTLPIFKCYKLSDQYLERYIENYDGQLDFDIAESLGRYVNSRELHYVAETIYKKAKHHSDFIRVIPEIYHLFGPMKQMKIYFKGWSDVKEIPEAKWWKAFASQVAELMPRGAFENEIWVHAGGNPAKLKGGGTGEESWYHAINLIKNRKNGAPRIENFILELRREFQHHESLNILLSYREKHYQTRKEH